MPKLPTRRNTNRIPQHNYSKPGHYFITICTENREELFGTIQNNEMVLNDVGKMINVWWKKIFETYQNISIDTYIIMSNHIHAIMNIVGADTWIGPIQNNTIDNKNGINTGENMVSPLQYKELGQYISWFKRMSNNGASSRLPCGEAEGLRRKT
ncbi:MAG: hypothetical protein WCY34_01065 [Candidatus Omnitrophota bacterium]|jgi:hypothetical protein